MEKDKNTTSVPKGAEFIEGDLDLGSLHEGDRIVLMTDQGKIVISFASNINNQGAMNFGDVIVKVIEGEDILGKNKGICKRVINAQFYLIPSKNDDLIEVQIQQKYLLKEGTVAKKDNPITKNQVDLRADIHDTIRRKTEDMSNGHYTIRYYKEGEDGNSKDPEVDANTYLSKNENYQNGLRILKIEADENTMLFQLKNKIEKIINQLTQETVPNHVAANQVIELLTDLGGIKLSIENILEIDKELLKALHSNTEDINDLATLYQYEAILSKHESEITYNQFFRNYFTNRSNKIKDRIDTLIKEIEVPAGYSRIEGISFSELKEGDELIIINKLGELILLKIEKKIQNLLGGFKMEFEITYNNT
ncbi:MAG: hypothetical protein ACOC1K_04440 [Nanoarchaeota archaeon]